MADVKPAVLLLSSLLILSAAAAPAQRRKVAPEPEAPTPAAAEAGVEVYFSPGGGCTDAIVREIDAAKSTVKVQAYRITSVPIVRALVKVHERGVAVTVVVDSDGASERKYSDATPLHNAGVPVWV